jgi:Tfp pilus assembly protein PilO
MRRLRVPIAGAVLAVVLVVAYVLGFHRPRSDAIAAAGAEVEQLRAQQALLQGDIAVLEQVEAREPELRAALNRLHQLIPSELAQPGMLTQLQAAAAEAGVELTSVTFGTPVPPEGEPVSAVPGTVLVQMAVTVAVEGRFAAVTELLRRVETEIDRAVLVGTVALTEAEAGFPEISGTWSGQAYALLPVDHPLVADPDAPPADAGAPPADADAPPAEAAPAESASPQEVS